LNDTETIADDDNEAAAAGTPPSRRLFTLQVVNSYGSTEVERLTDDGKPLNFDGKSKLSNEVLVPDHQHCSTLSHSEVSQ